MGQFDAPLTPPPPPPPPPPHTHIDTQKKLPSKSPPLLIGLMIFSRKYSQIFYTNLCVEFFLIWKYQEEIYSTLPQKLIIKRGFSSLQWKLLTVYFPDTLTCFCLSHDIITLHNCALLYKFVAYAFVNHQVINQSKNLSWPINGKAISMD